MFFNFTLSPLLIYTIYKNLCYNKFVREDFFMVYDGGGIVEKALDFATNAHKGQKRKGVEKEYITHPIAVYKLIQKYTDDVHVHCAALLHDVLENTEVTYEELVTEFGENIANIVLEVSDKKEDKKQLSWLQRRKKSIEKIPSLSDEAVMVELADKLHNVESLMQLPRKNSAPDFSNFKEKTPEYQEWYYRNMQKALQSRASSKEACRLSYLLGWKIDQVFRNKKQEYMINALSREVSYGWDPEVIRDICYRTGDLKKMLEKGTQESPIILEFFGTPKIEKKEYANMLCRLFTKYGIKTSIIDCSYGENKNMNSLNNLMTELEYNSGNDADVLFIIDGLIHNKVLASRAYFEKRINIYDEVEAFDVIETGEKRFLDGAVAFYEDSSTLLNQPSCDEVYDVETYNAFFLESKTHDFGGKVPYFFVDRNHIKDSDDFIEVANATFSIVESVLEKQAKFAYSYKKSSIK